jgi:EF hand
MMKAHYEYRKSALAAAVLLALTGSALSHAGGASKGDSAEAGTVKADVKQGFTSLDKNGDGHLSEQEFGAMGHPAQAFKDADINGDKRVDLAEYAGHAESKWMGVSKPKEPEGAAAPAEKSVPEKPKPGAY